MNKALFYRRLYAQRCDARTARNTRCKFTSAGVITEPAPGKYWNIERHEVCRIHFFGPVRGWW